MYVCMFLCVGVFVYKCMAMHVYLWVSVHLCFCACIYRYVCACNHIVMLYFLKVQKLVRQKQLEIKDFSVYWDTESEMLGRLPASQIQVSIL